MAAFTCNLNDATTFAIVTEPPAYSLCLFFNFILFLLFDVWGQPHARASPLGRQAPSHLACPALSCCVGVLINLCNQSRYPHNPPIHPSTHPPTRSSLPPCAQPACMLPVPVRRYGSGYLQACVRTYIGILSSSYLGNQSISGMTYPAPGSAPRLCYIRIPTCSPAFGLAPPSIHPSVPSPRHAFNSYIHTYIEIRAAPHATLRCNTRVRPPDSLDRSLAGRLASWNDPGSRCCVLTYLPTYLPT